MIIVFLNKLLKMNEAHCYYTCYYCTFDKLAWEELADHSCFGGDCTLCIEDNVVYREQDSNSVKASGKLQASTDDVYREEDTDLVEPNAELGSETSVQANNISAVNILEVEEQDHGKTDWQTAAVLLLIDEYRQHKTDLAKKNSVKKHIWQKVATNMNKHSYSYTWDQVQNKWKSLLRTYKGIKDHNNRTGKNRKNWAFFEAIDELMNDNPAIEPPLLIHNGDVQTPISESPTSSRASTPEISTKKRKSCTDVSELLQNVLKQNQAQHEEEMKEKRRFNDLLEKLINNVVTNQTK